MYSVVESRDLLMCVNAWSIVESSVSKCFRVDGACVKHVLYMYQESLRHFPAVGWDGGEVRFFDNYVQV